MKTENKNSVTRKQTCDYNKQRLNLADAQFIGYHFGKREPGIIHMVDSMGLTKGEWVKWKKNYGHTYLRDSEIKEINEHFKIIDKEQS